MVIYIKDDRAITTQLCPETAGLWSKTEKDIADVADCILTVHSGGTVEIHKCESSHILKLGNLFSLKDFLDMWDEYSGYKLTNFVTCRVAEHAIQYLKG